MFVLSLSSCSDFNRPSDVVVVGRSTMVIYHSEINPSERKTPSQGTYVYWVNDGSNAGWVFTSFEKYTIGDTVEIVVKHKSPVVHCVTWTPSDSTITSNSPTVKTTNLKTN